ncbi:MAG: fucose isomerase [Lachnospiraceae bacterium]|jgi:L-fucose isomerase-like protein|nr:fucose isomerase [Lachnospiraceae bacterium]
MYKKKIVIGVAPTKRSFLSMEEAKRQKDCFMTVIRGIDSEAVTLVDLDNVCENGIAFRLSDVPKAVKKFREAGIEALFIPFCDFGEEQVVAQIAATFRLPTLIWGARDERPNTFESRGRDTQCGMFAATKVMQRYGVTYSYIYNVEAESEEFRDGFDRFVRVAAVLRDLRTLRIAKIGERPVPFMSVMTNEADLIKKIGAVTVPIPVAEIGRQVIKLLEENPSQLGAYCTDLKARFSGNPGNVEEIRKIAATKIAIELLMEAADCTVGAFECWSAFPAMIGICPCAVLGEMADIGLPLACETDVNGAISLAILRACNLYKSAEFLADLTIRHPKNDNAELLWHCGPFPYSLKAPDSQASIIQAQESFELRQGDLTVCRFDDIDGNYSLFAGEAHTTMGPETTGTYVWMETDDWKNWEEKLMFGPYIHHLGVTYGHYLPVLREVARYLNITFDNAHEPGIRSL